MDAGARKRLNFVTAFLFLCLPQHLACFKRFFSARRNKKTREQTPMNLKNANKREYISIRVCHTSKRIKLITHIENAASAIYEWLWFKVVHFDMLSEKIHFISLFFFPSPDLFLPWVFVDVVESPRNKKNLSWRHHHLPNNEFHVCANMKCK